MKIGAFSRKLQGYFLKGTVHLFYLRTRRFSNFEYQKGMNIILMSWQLLGDWAPHQPNVTSLWDMQKNCIKPGYFNTKFDENLSITLSMFKCLRLFDLSFVADAHPVCEDIEDLFTIQIQLSTILSVKCPHIYAAEVEDVSSQTDRTDWWGKKKATNSQNGQMRARKHCYFSLHPPSESFFSVLSNSFSNRQERSLKDYTQSSIMVQYNSWCL